MIAHLVVSFQGSIQLAEVAGKPKKLALTARMRKLLVILNSMLKHCSPWCDLAPKVAGHSS